MQYARTAQWAPLFLAVGLLMLVAGSDRSAPPRVTPSPAHTVSDTKAAAPTLPAGLAPVVSEALAADSATEYGIVPATERGSDFRAMNPAQRLTAAFSPDGLSLAGDDATAITGRARLRLHAVGYDAALLPVVDASPLLSGTRVEYRRGSVTEWYLNSPLGVEQGFTLTAPPLAERTGNLVLALAVTDATATLDGGGEVLLTMPGGEHLHYGSLTVTDATGRTLPAQFAVEGSMIRIVVDDTAAVYPLVVDPLVQQGNKLTGSGESGAARFGFAVALSADGNTALVGAEADNGGAGAAFVFTRSSGVWSQQGNKLTGSGESGAGLFGYAIALSADGNTALIGAYADNSNVGAAFVFTRSGTIWSQQGNKLTGSGESGAGFFGLVVALSADGNTALVGAEADAGFVGAAFVFTRSGTIWSQQGGKLTGSGESGAGQFGSAVALSADGNTALVGAGADTGNTGAAFVFTRSGTIWSQQGNKLTGSGESAGGIFGTAVALSGDGNTALVGANADTGGVGAAFVFTRSGTTWSQQGSKLTGSGESGAGQFGYAVTLSGDGNTALIGANADTSNAGAAFVFTRSGTTWSQQGSKLTGSGESGAGQFGFAVALSGDAITALIGASADSSNVGAAYIFARPTSVVAMSGTNPQSTTVSTSFATSLTVHLADADDGTPIGGASVTFSAPTVGASGTFPGGVTSVTVTSDASGNATAPTFTANTVAGSYTLFVSALGQTDGLFQLANTAGSAKHIAATYGNDQGALIGSSFTTALGATVTDTNGNPVPGVSVTFAPPASGPSGAFTGSATVTTNGNGLALAPTFTANTVAGSYTVSATVSSVAANAIVFNPPIATSFFFFNIPGPAASLAVSAFPSSTVAGVPHLFTLTAQDVGGNTATSYTGTVHFTSSDPAATLPADYTFTAGDQGVHTFSASLATVGTGRSITATDTGAAFTGIQSGIAVTPSIINVSPFNGPQTGNTAITITGIGLTGATSVSLGGSACSSILVSNDGTSLTCTTTAHAAGTVDVTVTTLNGVGTLSHGYTYLPVAVPPLPRPQPGGGGGGIPAPLPASRPGSVGSGGGGSPPVAVPTGR